MKKLILKTIKFLKQHLALLFATLGVVLILIAVLFLTRKVNHEIKNYTIENVSVYQYFGIQKFDYDTKLTISNEKEITELKINDEVVELESNPFFYQDEKKVLFPKQMAVIFPLSNGQQRKIPYFTILDGSEIGSYLVNHNLNYSLQNAFLYDGNDLYFFPEGITIIINNQNYVLSPFSYVIINFYNNECYLYDYETQIPVMVVKENGDVIADGDGYKLNLSIDAINYNENSRLLLKNLNYLDNLK